MLIRHPKSKGFEGLVRVEMALIDHHPASFSLFPCLQKIKIADDWI